MNKNYLTSKAKTIEKVRLGDTYYNLEKKIDVENPIEEVSAIFKDLDFYERCKVILATTGMDIDLLNPYQIFCNLLRILPLLEKLLHTVELSSPSAGKSSMYQKISLKYYCSSGCFTEASLFGSIKPEKQGILSNYEAIAIDEVSDIDSIVPSLLTKFKDFLSSGNIARYGEVDFGTTSVAFLGNIETKKKYLSEDPFSIKNVDVFSALPEVFNNEAFKSRISYVIPGWILPTELPLITDENIKGLNTYLFVDYLTTWKKTSYSFCIKDYPELQDMLVNIDTRIKTTLERSIKAFLKLVFPENDYVYEDVIAIGEIIYACNRILSNKVINVNKSKFVQKLFFKLLKNKFIYSTSDISKLYSYGNRFIVRYKNDKDYLYKIAINNQGQIENEKEKQIFENSDNEIKEVLLPFISSNSNNTIAKFKYHEIYGGFKEIKLKSIEEGQIINLNNSIDLSSLIDQMNKKFQSLSKEISNLKNENNELKATVSSMGDYLCKLRKDTDGIRLFINEGSRHENLFYKDYNFFRTPKERIKYLFQTQIKEISNSLEISPMINEYEVCFDPTVEKFMLLNYLEIELKKNDPLDQFN